ncbi:MAG: response regulator, partial [Scytonema sp. PMC 1069.18]|nr:response regulator [Scytonema sp. PMC 1069.18]
IRAIILDVMMPEMDGLLTIRTIQKINPLVTIIASSGLTENQPLAEALGVKKFLQKPYTVKDLLQILQNVI